MRILFIHGDYLNYEVTEETEFAENMERGRGNEDVENPLIVFLSVEESDENYESGSDELVEKAFEEIKDVASNMGVENIVLFPFAHLTETLASPDYAISVLEKLEFGFEESEFDTIRVPFGWYKEFEFKSKGHPLSVLSRTVSP